MQVGFLLVATLMVLLTCAGYRYLAHTFKESVSRQQAMLLTVTARHVDDEVRRMQEMLSLIALSMDPDGLHDAATLTQNLDQVKSLRAFFDGGFQIIDSQGLIVAESPGSTTAGQASVKGRDYVAMGLATGKPYISAPYIPEAFPHHPLISFSVPIQYPDGSVAGLLTGSHDLLHGSGFDDLGQMAIGIKGSFSSSKETAR